jgi:hypothetical protein
MVDRSETMWKLKKGILFAAEFGEVEVSKDDVVTFDNFDSAKDLLNAYLMQKTDGTAMANTISKNVITITGTGTNVKCVYMVYGYKA